jgi:hypothetical protein
MDLTGFENSDIQTGVFQHISQSVAVFLSKRRTLLPTHNVLQKKEMCLNTHTDVLAKLLEQRIHDRRVRLP